MASVIVIIKYNFNVFQFCWQTIDRISRGPSTKSQTCPQLCRRSEQHRIDPGFGQTRGSRNLRRNEPQTGHRTNFCPHFQRWNLNNDVIWFILFFFLPNLWNFKLFLSHFNHSSGPTWRNKSNLILKNLNDNKPIIFFRILIQILSTVCGYDPNKWNP